MAGDWQEVAIGIIADIFDGPHATPAKAAAGPIFLGISNLSNGRLDLTDVEHLSEQDYLRWTRRVTPAAGDIVFSYETRLGQAAYMPPDLRCCLGRRMGLLRAKPGNVDSRFLLYAYLGPEFQETLRLRTIRGSTVDRIPLIEMPNFPIRIPRDIKEQRAIARILGTLDDKIELNRQMNETLESMARALFKSWFVKDVASGVLPSGWAVGKVRDLCSAIYSGGTPSTQNPAYWGGDLPWLSSGETREKIIIDTEKKITLAGVENSSTRLAPPLATVIASAGQGNTRGQTSFLTFQSYINQSVVVAYCESEK
jgi:type I restriction enzyme S subunit